MRTITTHDFLKEKLQNLRMKLIEQHKANTVRLDEIERHLLMQKNLVSYCATLKNKDIHKVAADLVSYVQTSDDRDQAVQLVTDYLCCFQSVSDA